MNSQVVCVDASLGLKLVLAEEDSPLAQKLWAGWIDREVEIVSTHLWAFEVTSVIRNKVHRAEITPEEGEKAFTLIHRQGVRLLYPDGLHRRAWEMAKHFDRPAAYDAHYLALAEMLGCEFWTADEKLYNAVKQELPWARWLGELAMD